jgi:hypothetical protein
MFMGTRLEPKHSLNAVVPIIGANNSHYCFIDRLSSVLSKTILPGLSRDNSLVMVSVCFVIAVVLLCGRKDTGPDGGSQLHRYRIIIFDLFQTKL